MMIAVLASALLTVAKIRRFIFGNFYLKLDKFRTKMPRTLLGHNQSKFAPTK